MRQANDLQSRLQRAILTFNFQLAVDSRSGALTQAWLPQTALDGSVVLSTQGLPFTVAGGDLLALFRCMSCRYRFSTDCGRPASMDAVGRVYSSGECEMSSNVQRYDASVYLRVEDAKRCRVHACMFLPVYASADREHPLAVVEVAQPDLNVYFPAIFTTLQTCLEEVNLFTTDVARHAMAMGLRSWQQEQGSALAQVISERTQPIGPAGEAVVQSSSRPCESQPAGQGMCPVSPARAQEATADSDEVGQASSAGPPPSKASAGRRAGASQLEVAQLRASGAARSPAPQSLLGCQRLSGPGGAGVCAAIHSVCAPNAARSHPPHVPPLHAPGPLPGKPCSPVLLSGPTVSRGTQPSSSGQAAGGEGDDDMDRYACMADSQTPHANQQVNNRVGGGAGKRLSLQELEARYGLGLRDAAASLRICPTTLKRACRRHGITRWPRRQLAKMGRSRSSTLDQSQGTSGGSSEPLSFPHEPGTPASTGYASLAQTGLNGFDFRRAQSMPVQQQRMDTKAERVAAPPGGPASQQPWLPLLDVPTANSASPPAGSLPRPPLSALPSSNGAAEQLAARRDCRQGLLPAPALPLNLPLASGDMHWQDVLAPQVATEFPSPSADGCLPATVPFGQQTQLLGPLNSGREGLGGLGMLLAGSVDLPPHHPLDHGQSLAGLGFEDCSMDLSTGLFASIL